jgi:hypothetical protein
MTPPKKRTYDFRILEWQVVTPEEQERICMQLLTSERLEISDAVRKLILEEWPELAQKLAPKRPPNKHSKESGPAGPRSTMSARLADGIIRDAIFARRWALRLPREDFGNRCREVAAMMLREFEVAVNPSYPDPCDWSQPNSPRSAVLPRPKNSALL